MTIMKELDQFWQPKKKFSKPAMLLKVEHKMHVTRIVQRKPQFLILVPSVYHDRFNTDYNIAKANNFADFLWPDVARIVTRNMEIGRPFMLLIIPIERILWQEAKNLVTEN